MHVDKKLLLCLAIFLLFSLASFFLPFFSSDEYGYMASGREIAGEKFATGGDVARFPLFPFLLSLIYQVFGYSEIVTKILLALLGVTTIFLFYHLAKTSLGEQAAFLSALVLASNPLFLYLSTRVLTEPLFFFLLIASVFALLKAFEARRYAFMFGLFAAALMLTRYVGAIIFLIALIYLAAFKQFGKVTLGRLGLFVAGFALVVIPWLWFSSQVTGNPLGLALSFFFQQLALSETSTFSLPDKLPLYLLVVPVLLGFASPLYWRGLANYFKGGFEKNKTLAVALITSLVFYVALEVYGIFNVALLRYIVPIVPFLAIFAGVNKLPFQFRGFEINLKIIAVAIGLNLLIAGAVFGFFANYPKYVGYREAGLWVKENCQSVNSNIQKIVFHYSGKENNLQGECAVVSGYDGVLEPPASQLLVYESHGVKVYKG